MSFALLSYLGTTIALLNASGNIMSQNDQFTSSNIGAEILSLTFLTRMLLIKSMLAALLQSWIMILQPLFGTLGLRKKEKQCQYHNY